jgi:hypothetical protein
MIMFIIAGRFLARYDYYKDVKSQQEITGLTLCYADVEHNNEMASSVVDNGNLCLYLDINCTDNAKQVFGRKYRKTLGLWQENEEKLTFHNGLEWSAS